MVRSTAAGVTLGVRVALAACAAGLPGIASAIGPPLAGENVNMVSGVDWPGGDPFLQRQNEPSIAVSAVNGRHLLAGANDYRSVDHPLAPGAHARTGDAWLGVFKSLNGGETWTSTLLPGYWNDPTSPDPASPLVGLQAAADPVVRPGPGGIFYYSGIAFQRDLSSGQVFVARFVDLDNSTAVPDAVTWKDPIAYVGTTTVDSGNSAKFLDKPWIATDIPRGSQVGKTCSVTARAGNSTVNVTVPRHTVYMAYSAFTGANSAALLFTRSVDCGATWAKPVKISPSDTVVNQAASIAIDPASGAVYVSWRRFQATSSPDAIMFWTTPSGDPTRGNTAREIAVRSPGTFFDQSDAATRFRSDAFPSIAASVAADDTRRVHVAWSERPTGTGDARIVLATASVSSNGTVGSFAVDTIPLSEPDQTTTSASHHQFMPSLTFTQGRLMIVYYDSHLDLYRKYVQFVQCSSSVASPGRCSEIPYGLDKPDVGYFDELMAPLVEGSWWNNLLWIDDADLPVRHTIDARVGTLFPPTGAATMPPFATTLVSRYPIGDPTTAATPVQTSTPYPLRPPPPLPDDVTLVSKQLQFNVPNFPMFATGTIPFMGDYIDVAGPMFRQSGSTWSFNTAKSQSAVHHVIWTSNQDVRPPPDGDWSRHAVIPNLFASSGTPVSAIDGSTLTQTCGTSTGDSGYTRTRDQNVYTSRITEGLLVTSPQNVKPLDAERIFVVTAHNATEDVMAVTFTIPASSPVASFSPTLLTVPGASPVTTRYVELAPLSTTSLSVFVQAYDPDPTRTPPLDINYAYEERPGGCTATTCATDTGTGFVTLNPPGSNLALYDQLGKPEPYDGAFTSTTTTLYDSMSTFLSKTSLSKTSLSKTSLSKTSLSKTSLSKTSLSKTSLSKTSLSKTSTSVAETTYTYTSTSSAETAVVMGTVGDDPNIASVRIFYTVSSPRFSPNGCAEGSEDQPVVVEATPGTGAEITVPRGGAVGITFVTEFWSTPSGSEIWHVAPTAIPDPRHPERVISPLLIITTTALPDGKVNESYSQPVASLTPGSGATSYSWSMKGLPPGLTYLATTSTPTVTLTGIPWPTVTQPAAGTFQVEITETSGGQKADRTIPLTIAKAPTSLDLSKTVGEAPCADLTCSSIYQQPAALKAFVYARDGASRRGVPVGTVTFQACSAGATCDTDPTTWTTIGSPVAVDASGSASVSLAGLGVATYAVRATYAENGSFLSSTNATTHTVTRAPTALLLKEAVDGTACTSPCTSAYGQTLTLTGQLTSSGDAPLSGMTLNLYAGTDTTAAPIASGTTNGTGSAVLLTTAALLPSTYTYTAVFVETATYQSASAKITHTVSSAATATQLLVPAGASCTTDEAQVTTCTSAYGDPVYLSAKVTSTVTGGAVAEGSAYFDADGTTLGQLAVGADGTGWFEYEHLAPTQSGAPHTLTVRYSGGAPRYAGSSASIQQRVDANPIATTLQLWATPSSVAAGQPVTFTATVCPSDVNVTTIPRGSVTFTIDGVASAPVSLSEAAVEGACATTNTATLQVSSLAVGAHTVSASYTPKDAWLFLPSSTSTSWTENVRYAFTGFLSPLTPAVMIPSGGSLTSSVQKLGSVVPIKWQLRDQNGYVGNVTGSGPTELVRAYYAGNGCPGSIGAIPVTSASIQLYYGGKVSAGGSTFRYDSKTNQYMYNWDTSKVPYAGAAAPTAGCWILSVSLKDGTSELVGVKLQ